MGSSGEKGIFASLLSFFSLQLPRLFEGNKLVATGPVSVPDAHAKRRRPKCRRGRREVGGRSRREPGSCFSSALSSLCNKKSSEIEKISLSQGKTHFVFSMTVESRTSSLPLGRRYFSILPRAVPLNKLIRGDRCMKKPLDPSYRQCSLIAFGYPSSSN